MATAPISVPMFHSVKTARPVAQNANRDFSAVSRAIAIAVVSSMTKWAEAARRGPVTPSSDDSLTP